MCKTAATLSNIITACHSAFGVVFNRTASCLTHWLNHLCTLLLSGLSLFYLISVLGMGVLHVLHPRSGGFSGVWWILGTLVTHTSACTQARCRSDLHNGCVKQRLPAQARKYQITLLFPLYPSAQHYLFCLLPSSFSHLPPSFFLRSPPPLSLVAF